MADTKITGLTADTAPTSDDLVVTVNDPAGTPANRKVTVASLISSSTAFSGAHIQTVDSIVSAVNTGSTVIPYDDTIPQITEGDEYITKAITPTNSSNKLIIEGVVNVASSAASQRMIAALFQDSTANALAVGTVVNVTANTGVQVYVYHSMTAGTTAATTFRIRAGANNAGTTTLNGDTAARKFGGISYSWLRITEIKV